MVQKRLLPLLIATVVGFVFCFVLFDAYATSIADFLLWSLLWIGIVFVLLLIEGKSRKGFVLGVVALLITTIAFNLVKIGHFLPQSLIQPTPNEIALQFTEALTTGNEEMALALTDGSTKCQMVMNETFQLLEQEAEQRYGAEWRNQDLGKINPSINFFMRDPFPRESITVIVYEADNASPYFVFGLNTTYNLVGSRYTCGQALNTQQANSR